MGAFTFLSSTRSHEKQGCQHKASDDRPGGYDDLPTATCKHWCRRQSRDTGKIGIRVASWLRVKIAGSPTSKRRWDSAACSWACGHDMPSAVLPV
jgi:hypothetical protein